MIEEKTSDRHPRPSQAELERFARDFIHQKHRSTKQGRNELRAMKANGDFEAVVQGKVEACTRKALQYIDHLGIFPPQAWHWAIREAIWETDPD